MAEAPATFVWRDGALVERPLEPHRALVVADSFFVSPDGRARALETHHERFRTGIGELGGPSVETVDAFWGAVIGRLRAYRGSALFPRVELAGLENGGLELRLRVRVAPRRRESAVLSTHAGPDPRSVPRIKGPDLEELIALRAAAQENGADEVVLLKDGLVVDGSSSAVLWWRGETLAAPPGDLARVASVTARSIRLIASATGTRVVEERARPADLEGCEVWVVSALHGISVVDAWIDGPVVVVRPSRAATWQRRLDALARPL
ncbi:aminotransferase class IV [Herbiconiux sp.]|uniref:aminotransferase class IV n=1 Tax=Herbiconiux sp. TaxID=1871186 RepID=UPI0025C339DA|nr:aminotransferase class IV [Herbiconiux sp.]